MANNPMGGSANAKLVPIASCWLNPTRKTKHGTMIIAPLMPKTPQKVPANKPITTKIKKV